ncbi:conjugative transposon protein TraN [Pinibacter aurantiacus]|uniref:Conjugative transposon protein TraN n=1 Tax=Pinibacter aurantiacus TaxID=2851599 RepID=A0A9E2SDD5_9BACT|nr:conjugative transposon protein TraN [Pinibacter aurantiacus]MBV4359069.1 conjugative transposon protein TraN [Pinibacter aurantiacus]
MEKCKRIVALVISVSLFVTTFGQQQDANTELTNIQSLSIEVGYSKTSNIVFPSKIISIDRGSQSIILQKAKGVENILQIKAAKRKFQETNLTVITADGKFYSFLVDYSDSPAMLNIDLSQQQVKDLTSTLLMRDRNVSVLEKERNEIPKQRSFLKFKRTNQKVSVHLKGIYLGDRSMWFALEVINKSFIEFKPAQIRFFIKDKRRSKRTAIQEQEVSPIYSIQLPIIKKSENKSIATAFIPFTILSSKRLVIAINEEAGSRELILPVKYKTLVRAKPISE